MPPEVELVLGYFLCYVINLASSERTTAIGEARAKRLEVALSDEENLKKAFISMRSVKDEVPYICNELARNRTQLGVTPQEEPLWNLFTDEIFQADLADWLMAGTIEEGDSAKSRMLKSMEDALLGAGASPEQITYLNTEYLDALERMVFSHPVLAAWRHQLSLDYIRARVTEALQRAEEAAGVFSQEKQTAALDKYCEKALAAWDIIDLSNLPEGDVDIPTQKLLLRQLYMPLRIEVEPTQREGGENALERLESRRDARRRREAGHTSVDAVGQPALTRTRSAVGTSLGLCQRLVVLGDPGGGKTTMLRWMATAFLLRYKADDAFAQLPDTETLANQSFIPVLIRCRDLGDEDLCRSFTDFLTQHLNKSELLPRDAEVMRAVILERVAKGEALLLIDGLDEITDPRIRMMFCQELERTAARYPQAPIVVTSRIVGYRDMPYRMGSGFEHGVIAELDREDKDLFAQRWVEVTEQHQTSQEKATRTRELIDALHSSDRIERLTGNPMLLTTVALVKRKVGKLPTRRTKLYAEAVSVLLNWNPRYYQTIDENEAIPQLEYLAYEMCRQGVQRLNDDEVLTLLDNLRTEYRNIRAVTRRKPEEFLALLEARSSILIKSGGIWATGSTREKSVWEFRHLTFQEYLAARALVDGRYPGRDRTKPLAEHVAPLAGAVKATKSSRNGRDETEVPESWREALRLLVADCNDDDVDDVLQAIGTPLPDEDVERTGKPRAVLAGLCLADEPNVSEENAKEALVRFVANIGESDGNGGEVTSLDRATREIAYSLWSPILKELLINSFHTSGPKSGWNAGGLWGMAEVLLWKRSGTDAQTFSIQISHRLKSDDPIDRLAAALAALEAAYEGELMVIPDLSHNLFDLLESGDKVERFTVAWALGWMIDRIKTNHGRKFNWKPSQEDVSRMCNALDSAEANEIEVRRWLAGSIGYTKDLSAFPSLERLLYSQDDESQQLGVSALEALGDDRAVPALISKLDSTNKDIRISAIKALAQFGGARTIQALIIRLIDSDPNVRQAVVRSLGELDAKQAATPLLGMLNDSDQETEWLVMQTLAKLNDLRVVPPLLERLDASDESLCIKAINILANLSDERIVSPLVTKLSDVHSKIRQAASYALGKQNDPRIIEPLIAAIADPDISVATSAAEALASLGMIEGIEARKKFITSDASQVRYAAVSAYAARQDFINQHILSVDFDGLSPWIDLKELFNDERVAIISDRLQMSPNTVRPRCQSMATELGFEFGLQEVAP